METVTFWDRIGLCRGRGNGRDSRRGKGQRRGGDKQLSSLYASESFIYELGQLTQGLATHTHSREGGTTQARKKVNVLLQLQRLSLFTASPLCFFPLLYGVKLAIVFDFDFDMEMEAEADDGRQGGGTICCGYVQSKCQECSLMLYLSLSVFSLLPLPLSLSLFFVCGGRRPRCLLPEPSCGFPLTNAQTAAAATLTAIYSMRAGERRE